MRLLVCIFLSLLASVSRAESSLVYHIPSSRIVYELNSDTVMPIASITKVVSSLVGESFGNPKDVVTISVDDFDLIKGTRSKLKPGEVYYKDDILSMMLLASENRAAYALSRMHPSGRAGFVHDMNNFVQSIGMTSSRFIDPAGLSPENVSTARDLLILALEFRKHQTLIDKSITPSISFGHKRTFLSTNRFIRDRKSSHNIVLQKTGFIRESKQCLLMISGDYVYVILGAKNKYTSYSNLFLKIR